MKLRLHKLPLIFRALLPTVVVAVLTLSCGLSAATAQPQQTELQPIPPADNFAAESAPTEFMPGPADTGFWFLTTENSPQCFNYSRPRFCPCVSRYEQCVGFRHSSLSELCQGLEPGVPVCIVIHGSFVETDAACRESIYVWKWLRSAGRGQRMQMIHFSWPSFRYITLLAQIDVNLLGRQAARNGYYLAELLHHIPGDCPVCLFGHSHGTRVVAAGLHLLAGGAIQGVCHPYARVNGRPIRAVFTAAAIDHNWLNPGNRYDRALCGAECLLNMTNCADPALRVYPLRLPLLAKQPIGLAGLSQRDRRRLGVQSHKVLDYDVTRAVGARHLLPYYFSNNDLALVMRNYVYFPDRVAPMTTASADIARLR